MNKGDIKLIWSNGASVLITALLVLGGIELTGDKNYGCEDRNIIMKCDSLSKYYSLPNGKCYNSELGNKLCKTGWTQDYTIEDEVEISEAIQEVTQPKDCPISVIAYTDNGKYYCEGIGADQKCTHTTEILSELG